MASHGWLNYHTRRSLARMGVRIRGDAFRELSAAALRDAGLPEHAMFTVTMPRVRPTALSYVPQQVYGTLQVIYVLSTTADRPDALSRPGPGMYFFFSPEFPELIKGVTVSVAETPDPIDGSYRFVDDNSRAIGRDPVKVAMRGAWLGPRDAADETVEDEDLEQV